MKKTGNTKSGTTKQASMKPPTYQPSRQEMNQEHDMPGASMETLRQAFFQPASTSDAEQKPRQEAQD